MQRFAVTLLAALVAVLLVSSPSAVSAKSLEEKVEAYNRWINSLNFGFESCCQLAPVPDKGYGMIALRDFSEGETMVKFPPSEVLTYRTIVANYPEWAAIDWGEIPEASRVFPVLALFIQHEKELNPASPYTPFLDLIDPSNVDSTVYWSDEEMEEIKGTLLFKQTLMRRAFVVQLWKQIEPVLQRYPSLFPPEFFTFENFRLYSYFIMSRSWGNLSNLDNAIRVIPHADMWNHEIRAHPLGRTEDGWNQFTAHKDLKKGEEISISYGNPLPENTLLLFGFVDTSEGASTQSLGELTITTTSEWLPGRVLGPWLHHFFTTEVLQQGGMRLTASLTFPAANLNTFLTYFRIAHLKIEEITDENLKKLKEHQSISFPNDLMALRSAIAWVEESASGLGEGSLEEDMEYLAQNRANWGRRRIMAVEHRIRVKRNLMQQKSNLYQAWMKVLIDQ